MKNMIVMCGKSGSGKNYIPEALGLKLCVGNTSRLKRDTDVDYRFYDYNYFDKNIELKDVIIPTYYCDNYYWTMLEDFQDKKYDYMVADNRGVEELLDDILHRDLKRGISFVYVETPLISRIRNMRRRKNSWSQIWQRLIVDRDHFKNTKKLVLENNGVVIKGG